MAKSKRNTGLQSRIDETVASYMSEIMNDLLAHLAKGRFRYQFVWAGDQILVKDFSYSSKWGSGTSLGVIVYQSYNDYCEAVIESCIWVAKPPTRSSASKHINIACATFDPDPPADVARTIHAWIDRNLHRAIEEIARWEPIG